MSLELSGSCGCSADGTGLSLNLELSGGCCSSKRAIPPAVVLIQRDLIRVVSSDFVSAYEWEGHNSEGVGIEVGDNFKIFYNDGNRYLREGTEWTRTTLGFHLVSLDTTTGDMEFYVHINKV